MGAILPGDGKGTLFAAAHFVRFWHKAVMAIISSVMSAFGGKADIHPIHDRMRICRRQPAAVSRASLVTPFDPKAQQFADEAQYAGAKARLVGPPRAK